MPATRRRGRPPLDPDDPSVKVTISVPATHYDRLWAIAQRDRCTLPALMRKVLRLAVKDETPKG